MRVFGYLPPVMVFDNIPMILFPPLRIGKIFNIIANRDNKLVGDKPFVYQIQHKEIGHLPQDEFCFLRFIRAV